MKARQSDGSAVITTHDLDMQGKEKRIPRKLMSQVVSYIQKTKQKVEK